MRVLILGGTGEARALASALADLDGVEFESSLAGRVTNPALPVGPVRVGGFGGAAGLAAYLRAGRFDAVIDATHPFAAGITSNAAVAAVAAGVRLVVVRRPAWVAESGDDWRRVADISAAAELVASMDVACVFLTTGRRDLAVFAGDSRHGYLVRTVDPPVGPTPARMILVLSRGPYSVAGERALLAEHSVDVLVTKNSGGSMTSAKLIAARERGIAVLMVARPAVPNGVAVVESVEAAIGWLWGSIG